ncbi:MAG TPA: D-alanine--D-alanine ligase [Nitrospiria bacterium]|nr:D-alanine--D-alanine ligase [Nitrospiria bacterium]
MTRPCEGRRIGVLRGGQSTERDVSLRSGVAVAAALKRQGYEVTELEPDRALLAHLSGEIEANRRIEAAFIVLHGRGGEDGQIQSVLEWAGIPYTGSGVLASAIGMNKAVTKQLMQVDGIPTPQWFRWRRGASPPPVERFPVVVKPTSEGSTVGVSIVTAPGDLPDALEQAGRYDGDVLIEEYIDGAELTVAVLDGEPLPPIEIVPKESFYNYEAKYTPGRCEYRLPPVNVTEPVWREAQGFAARLDRLLGCAGATRVDFRVDRAGRPWVLEINTVPGMTETSLLPKAAAAAGLRYDEVVLRILASAQGRMVRKGL